MKEYAFHDGSILPSLMSRQRAWQAATRPGRPRDWQTRDVPIEQAAERASHFSAICYMRRARATVAACDLQVHCQCSTIPECSIVVITGTATT
jgi:hypothetical protein